MQSNEAIEWDGRVPPLRGVYVDFPRGHNELMSIRVAVILAFEHKDRIQIGELRWN